MNIKDICLKFHQERQVKAAIGMSSKQFAILLLIFTEFLNAQIEENKVDKKKPNNGKIGVLKTPTDKLFFVLFYLKCYPTFDVLGLFFDMSGSSAHIWLSKLMPVFIKTLDDFNVFPKTEFKTPEEMREFFKEHDTLLIDATERAIQRPQDDEIQEDHYSGKKSCHTMKNTIIATLGFVILYIGRTFSGKNNDFGMFKKEFKPGENWFSTFNILVDLGYLGFNSNYKTKSLSIPHKKPRKSKNNPNPELTKEQKDYNREVNRRRVIVENVIAGMKRLRCVSDRYRNHIPEFKDLFILLAAGIWNFNVANRI